MQFIDVSSETAIRRTGRHARHFKHIFFHPKKNQMTRLGNVLAGGRAFAA